MIHDIALNLLHSLAKTFQSMASFYGQIHGLMLSPLQLFQHIQGMVGILSRLKI